MKIDLKEIKRKDSRQINIRTIRSLIRIITEEVIRTCTSLKNGKALKSGNITELIKYGTRINYTNILKEITKKA